MNYLAIDTSGSRLTVAAKFGEKRVLRRRDDCKTGHAAFLMDEIDDVLETLKTDLSKVDFIACVIGTGSFTGIRIGVATVKALCFAYNKPALALTSFDVLAYTNLESENKICLINAMHGNFYAQTFSGLTPSGAPAFLTESEIFEKYAEYVKIVDCDCDKLNVKATDTQNAFVSAVESEYLKAVATVEENKENKTEKLICGDLLSPLYVKKSQAEEELCK